MTLEEFVKKALSDSFEDEDAIAEDAASVTDDATLREAAEDFLMARDDFRDAVEDVVR